MAAQVATAERMQRGLTHKLVPTGAAPMSRSYEPPNRVMMLQRTIGNQAVAQLLRDSALGVMHAPPSVQRMSIIQRCGPVACNCSAEKQAAHAAKAKPPQCGVSSPDEMGADAVNQVVNASESDEPAKDVRTTPPSIDGFDRPMAGGSATIVCDGKGGYRVALNDWAGAPCGTEGCVKKHEQQHIKDWKKRWPSGCKPKADHADGSDIPLGGEGYDAFLNDSECKAHTVDLKCADTLVKSAKGDCKAKV